MSPEGETKLLLALRGNKSHSCLISKQSSFFLSLRQAPFSRVRIVDVFYAYASNFFSNRAEGRGKFRK